jgi:nitroreductase
MSEATVPSARRPATEALVDAARRAGHAPSIFNTQPWRWRVVGDAGGDPRMELWADRSRQLRVVDPDGRLLALSCGAGLHHARIALAAGGHSTSAHLLPDPTDPDLLATVRLGAAQPPDPATLALAEAIGRRRTDRRAYGQAPAPDWAVGRGGAAGPGLP